MAKSPKSEPDKLSKRETQERFERAVDHMLSTPPRPHEPARKKPKGHRAAKD